MVQFLSEREIENKELPSYNKAWAQKNIKIVWDIMNDGVNNNDDDIITITIIIKIITITQW